MAKIGDYWSEEQTTEIVNLLKEFQDVFSRYYKDVNGLVHEMRVLRPRKSQAATVKDSPQSRIRL